MIEPIQLEEIRRAAALIEGEAIKTPALSSAKLDKIVGARVVCKAESLQRTGSFKFRGAFHRLSLIPEIDRTLGVVAVSSGNHGAAVACAAQILGMDATIHIPHDTPNAKRDLIESFGAAIITFDRSIADRESPARTQAQETGATFVHPFEDRDVMIGQGTAALELYEQINIQHGAALDVLFVPMSGGGLMAGSGSAIRGLSPECRLIGVEPANADDTARSFRAGHPIRIDQPTTVADGLAVTSPGINTFALNSGHVDELILVSEKSIIDAMRVVRDMLDLQVEPSGAAALAAVLDSGAPDGRWAGLTVGVILSGGNIDATRFAELVESGPRSHC
jgi:threonine dehydratase